MASQTRTPFLSRDRERHPVQEVNGQFVLPYVLYFDALPPSSDTYRDCPECGQQFSLIKCSKKKMEGIYFPSGRQETFTYEVPCCQDCGRVCSCCGHAADDEHEMHNLDDEELVCGECSCECDTCGRRILNDDAVEARSGFPRGAPTRMYCEEHCFKCADCGEYYANSRELDTYVNTSDDRICERCSDSYLICDSCSCRMESGADSYYSIDGDGCYCQACYEQHESDNELEVDGYDEVRPGLRPQWLHSYSHKPYPLFKFAPGQLGNESLFFGIELEVDRRRESFTGPAEDIESAEIPDAFYCKEDGSLDYGFEVVSHPGTYEYFAKADWTFADRLREMNYRSYDTRTCGMHIHVSRAALSSLDILKLLEFFNRNPNFVEYISRRNGAQSGKMKEWAAVSTGKRQHFISKVQRVTSGIRYEAINLLPRNTIEFRIFRGTLAVNSILRNLGFVRTLIAYVKQSALEEMSLTGYRRWLDDNASKVLGRGSVAKSLIKWVGGFDLDVMFEDMAA